MFTFYRVILPGSDLTPAFFTGYRDASAFSSSHSGAIYRDSELAGAVALLAGLSRLEGRIEGCRADGLWTLRQEVEEVRCELLRSASRLWEDLAHGR